jgi:hypothetical protein
MKADKHNGCKYEHTRIPTTNKQALEIILHHELINDYLITELESNQTNNKICGPEGLKCEYERASVLNKYHNYFWTGAQHSAHWKMLKSIQDDYLLLRKKAESDIKLISNDFDNLLSEEKLMFLHKQITSALMSPKQCVETGIDEFEITFRIPSMWRKSIFKELRSRDGVIKKKHFASKGYKQRYGRSVQFQYRTGGIFVFYYMKTQGDCLISFRLSQTPWRNIRHFFNCIKSGLGTNYKEFLDHAKVTRVDPYLLIKNYPIPMLLVNEDYKPSGKPISTSCFRENGGFARSIYSGDRSQSSHFIFYDMLLKFKELKKDYTKGKRPTKNRSRFKKLFNQACSVFCISKIERRIRPHKNGSSNNNISDIHKLNGHAFERLKFYSPLVFQEISHSIRVMIFTHGFANVNKYLKPKQKESLDKVLAKPEYQLYFDHKSIMQLHVRKIEKLQCTIKHPDILPDSLRP